MGKSCLTLGSGSHCGPFFHMKNTLHQPSYVVPVGVGTADLATVFPRNTFGASFPTSSVWPAPEGPEGPGT